jgi:hypothetical protein
MQHSHCLIIERTAIRADSWVIATFVGSSQRFTVPPLHNDNDGPPRARHLYVSDNSSHLRAQVELLPLKTWSENGHAKKKKRFGSFHHRTQHQFRQGKPFQEPGFSMIPPCNGLAAFTKKHSDTPTPYSRLRPNVERRTMNENSSHHIGRTTNEIIHRTQFGCFYPKHNDYKNHSPELMTLSTTRQISRLKTLRPNGLVIRKEQGVSPLQNEDVH